MQSGRFALLLPKATKRLSSCLVSLRVKKMFSEHFIVIFLVLGYCGSSDLLEGHKSFFVTQYPASNLINKR